MTVMQAEEVSIEEMRNIVNKLKGEYEELLLSDENNEVEIREQISSEYKKFTEFDRQVLENELICNDELVGRRYERKLKKLEKTMECRQSPIVKKYYEMKQEEAGLRKEIVELEEQLESMENGNYQDQSSELDSFERHEKHCAM